MAASALISARALNSRNKNARDCARGNSNFILLVNRQFASSATLQRYSKSLFYISAAEAAHKISRKRLKEQKEKLAFVNKALHVKCRMQEAAKNARVC